jgi:hypothetical protein
MITPVFDVWSKRLQPKSNGIAITIIIQAKDNTARKEKETSTHNFCLPNSVQR